MPFSATLAIFHMNSIDTPHKGESRSQGFSDVKRAWSYGWRAMILGACSGGVGLVFVHQFGCFCSFQVLSIATIKKPAELDGLNCSSQNLLHHIPLVLVYRANLRISLLLEWLPMGDQCNWVSPIRHYLYAVNYPQFHSVFCISIGTSMYRMCNPDQIQKHELGHFFSTTCHVVTCDWFDVTVFNLS